MKIGVFICHCGSNIAGTVAVQEVLDSCKDLPYVRYVADYKYFCSEPGQNIIKNAIKDHKLTRVVIGSCSPRMHEKTFQKVITAAGLNPYLLQIVNLREHCSWVHKDNNAATEKAKILMNAAISKIIHNAPLFSKAIPITKRALIIGAGIAGIQAALDIADSGFEVILVEKEPSIGGRMAQLDKTFPTLDCSACILTPKMVDAASHPNINLKTYAEVTKVFGSVGNFTVTIKNRARYVKTNCTACGECFRKCPGRATNQFNEQLNNRTAIYIPFPQAVPTKAVIDRDACLHFKTGKCKLCEKTCGVGAIDFTMQDITEEVEVGVIVVATGYDLFDYSKYGEYGAGKFKNVISSMQLERLISSSGPTGAKLLIPGTEQTPKNIVFIQCIGSRDEKKGKTYCSKICCMYTAKHAILLKEKFPDAKISIFYMDLRTPGKNYEEFSTRAQRLPGVNYLRGRVAKLTQSPNGQVNVSGVDTLLGKRISLTADLVVLATGVTARDNIAKLAQVVGVPTDKDGFFNEAHPKLKPVEAPTVGVYIAGACQGPKDIPETVSCASAAAAKAITILNKNQLSSQPMTAEINQAKCSGCHSCVTVCPFKAIEKTTTSVGKNSAKVKEELCQGCGACVSTCRSGALFLKGYSDNMLLAEVDSICKK